MKKKFLALVLTLAMVLSLVPVTALAVGENDPVTEVSTDANSPVQIKKSVNKQGNMLTLEAYLTNEVTQTVSAKPLDIVLVLDQSGSMAYDFDGETTSNYSDTRQCAMKSAVVNFVDKVNEQYSEKGDHRMAIVTFGSEASTLHDWTAVDTTGAASLKDKVNTLPQEPTGATNVGAGMEMAKGLMNSVPASSNTTHQKVVIVFTDGVPTKKSDFSINVANAAITASKDMKDAGAVVYTVGIFNGANPDEMYGASGFNTNSDGTIDSVWRQDEVGLFPDFPTVDRPAGNRFLNLVSNNYPAADSIGLKRETYGLGILYYGVSYTITQNFDRTASNYYLAATNADGLNSVFEKIIEEISTLEIEAGTDAILSDTLSEYFDLNIPEGATEKKDAITVEQWNCIGKSGNDYAWKKADPQPMGLTVTVNGKTINVTGFNYTKNAVTATTKNGTTNYSGSKLVVTIPIKVNQDYDGWEAGTKNYDTNTTGDNNKAGLTNYKKVEENASTLLNESPQVPVTAYTVTYKYDKEYPEAPDLDNYTKAYLAGTSIKIEEKPTWAGYTFNGWTTSDAEISNGKFEMPAQNVELTGSWIKNNYNYTIEYYYDGMKDDSQTETKSAAYGSEIKNYPDKSRTGYKLAKTENLPLNVSDKAADNVIMVYYVKDEVKNTINQHFMDGKDKERDDLRVNGDAQMKPKGTPLSDLIEGMTGTQPKGDKKYVYVPSETKVNKTSSLEETPTLTEDTTIDLYYYLDDWKDGDSKTPPESDSATGGDGIPDCYQVLVKYQSGDLRKGKIADTARTQEVLTIKDKEKNVYLSEGQVTASGSTAEATGSRCYFSNWTDTTSKQVDTNATLGKLPFDAVGGKTYTFTANFDRSSGGGSGGSNRPKPPVVEIPDDVPTGLNGKDHYAYVVGYPDGMVYPQKNITRAEVATIFFRLLTDETREANMTKSNSYNDMKDGAWYTCAVSTLSKMGIIKGYEDGSFKPDASISRAEFAAIAARFDPDGDKTPATFSDVSSHWAKDEISIAANHGWIKGYEDGSFKPDQKITRAETMTLVNRVLKRLPETKDDLHKDMKTWPDNQNESAWFYLAVQEATNSHYQKLKKDGTHETWESMRETRDWAALEK